MERQWLLGEDLSSNDNLLDGITFYDLILQVHCNCRKITPQAVRKELEETLSQRIEDMRFLLENNMQQIMDEAMEGREY
jgi:hypothetical protein